MTFFSGPFGRNMAVSGVLKSYNLSVGFRSFKMTHFGCFRWTKNHLGSPITIISCGSFGPNIKCINIDQKHHLYYIIVAFNLWILNSNNYCQFMQGTKLSAMEYSWILRRQVSRWKYSFDHSRTFKGPPKIHFVR